MVEVNPDGYRNESKFGAIPGIEVGATWRTRQVAMDLLQPDSLITYDTIREECSKARVHTSTTAGISGGKDGAYSIVMSGGYDDDHDRGNDMRVADFGSLVPLILPVPRLQNIHRYGWIRGQKVWCRK